MSELSEMALRTAQTMIDAGFIQGTFEFGQTKLQIATIIERGMTSDSVLVWDQQNELWKLKKASCVLDHPGAFLPTSPWILCWCGKSIKPYCRDPGEGTSYYIHEDDSPCCPDPAWMLGEIARLEKRNQWIPCEKRMPTKEDGDKWGNVLWGNDWEHCPIANAPWYNPEAIIKWSHWMTPPTKPLSKPPEES